MSDDEPTLEPIIGPHSKPFKTQAPLSTEPSEPQSDSDGSPSAIREAEAQLTLRWTHLKEGLPREEALVRASIVHLREHKAEMVEIERLLKAHKRLKNPVRRTRKP